VSQWPPVDRQRIEDFLEALGREVEVPRQVFLVGGTTLVYAGLRAQTIDIDLTFDVAPAHTSEFVRAVRRLKDQLQVNVGEVSPADFIPLPSGSRDRARYVGRYGRLDVYHFDPYSTALSKIERGREEDLHDVAALLDAGWLSWDRLNELLEDVLPRMATESLKGNPDQLRRNFEALHDLRRRAG
jgi:hypothetical protein